jgi:hypothetical protein
VARHIWDRIQHSGRPALCAVHLTSLTGIQSRRCTSCVGSLFRLDVLVLEQQKRITTRASARAGATKLRTSVLPAEDARVQEANMEERESQADMTLLLNGWTNHRMERLMGWLLRHH